MFEKMIEQAISWVFDTGVNLLVALLILLIGLKLIKKVRTIADRTMEKAGVETTLRRFLNALLYALMIGILIFVVAGEIGIEVTSLVALVGSVGLALSLAMEKSLADAMKTMLGINPRVHLVAPKSIVRSEGKAVRVIDKRKLI